MTILCLNKNNKHQDFLLDITRIKENKFKMEELSCCVIQYHIILGWMWWLMFIIPAMQEAEMGRL
jgi:hypothetical protein